LWERQRDLKRPLFSVSGLDCHYTAMGFYDALYFGKRQGCAALNPLHGAAPLAERVEKRSQGDDRHSASVGTQRDGHLARPRPDANFNLAPRPGKLDCMAYQAVDGMENSHRIDIDRRQCPAIRFHIQLDLFPLGCRLILQQRSIHQRLDIGALDVESQFSGFDLREFNHVVDQP